jgi:ABC-2 type transport system ATP-binding protein
MPDLAIATQSLTKVFGSKVAVENLTLEVRRGEVFGFLGPNGAGKSTFVKMLLGLVSPTGGAAEVLGRPLGDLAARRGIGFLPEHFRFYERLTAGEFMEFHGRLYAMPRAERRKRAMALLDLVGLTAHRDKNLRSFSKGMLQRIGLAQALLNDPELIFLDEPTSGLDPIGRRLVRDIIREQRSRGAAVFLNSHLLSEVEITCDRVAFIKHGRILEVREIAKIIANETTVSARVRGVYPDTLAGLERWARSEQLNGERLTMTIEDEAVCRRSTVTWSRAAWRSTPSCPRSCPSRICFIRIVGTEGGL